MTDTSGYSLYAKSCRDSIRNENDHRLPHWRAASPLSWYGVCMDVAPTSLGVVSKLSWDLQGPVVSWKFHLKVRRRAAAEEGAPRSGSDISQPPSNTFCIVFEWHCCTQTAPLITPARGAPDPEPQWQPSPSSRQEDKARLSSTAPSAADDCCPLVDCVCVPRLCVCVQLTESKW